MHFSKPSISSILEDSATHDLRQMPMQSKGAKVRVVDGRVQSHFHAGCIN